MMPPYLAAAAIAACLCMLAASAVPHVQYLFRKKMPVSQRRVDMFMNKLIHESAYGDFRFVTFRIDCFLFDFRKKYPNGLPDKIQYEFVDYTRTLDLANQQAIVKMAMWLIQHGIDFELKYQWNWDLPVRYNIGQRKKPAYLWKLIQGIDHDDLMAYDLSKDTHALHP